MSELNYAIYYLKTTTISIQNLKNSTVKIFIHNCPIGLKLLEICLNLNLKLFQYSNSLQALPVFLYSLGQFWQPKI